METTKKQETDDLTLVSLFLLSQFLYFLTSNLTSLIINVSFSLHNQYAYTLIDIFAFFLADIEPF